MQNSIKRPVPECYKRSNVLIRDVDEIEAVIDGVKETLLPADSAARFVGLSTQGMLHHVYANSRVMKNLKARKICKHIFFEKESLKWLRNYYEIIKNLRGRNEK